MVEPWFRFHIPLIEPDMQISRIRLSDKTSRLCFRVQRLLQFLNTRGVDRLPKMTLLQSSAFALAVAVTMAAAPACAQVKWKSRVRISR